MVSEAKLAKAIRRALDAAIAEAKLRGAVKSCLYFEAEGLVVVDRAIAGWHKHLASDCQAAIVMRLPGAYPPFTDVGAW